MTLGTPPPHRTRLAAAVFLLLAVGALLPGAAHPIAPHSTSPLSGLAPSDVPAALPSHPGVVQPASTHVNPFALISSEPAPMGIADFGVTGVTGDVHAYSYASNVFQGNVQVNSMLTFGGGAYYMTFQLNTVIVLSHGGTNYSYWIQNIASIDSSSQGIGWIDNIWNLSSPTAALSTGELTGNGSVNNYPGFSWYADSAGSNFPGSQVTLSYPANLSIRSIVSTVNGFPHVGFTYNDGYGWVTYDNVTFAHAQGWNDYGFVVNGYSYTPLGIFYDAEWDYAGSGIGQHNIRSDLNMSLQYWNGHNYQSVPNAWNFGSDTAESLDNVISSLGPAPSNGSLYSHLTNGSGSLGLLYNASQVGTLIVSAPSLPVGSIRLNGSPFPYRGGEADFTLAPGDYEVDLYDGATFLDSSNVSVGAGATARLTLPFPRQSVTFHETGLPAGTPWSVTVGSSVLASTTPWANLTEKDGSYAYSIAGVPGYQTPSYGGPFYVSGAPVVVSVPFWTFNFSVDFTAFGLPSGTPWWLTLDGVPWPETGPVVAIGTPNGTHIYSIATVNTYIGNPDNGSVLVEGAPVSVDLTFVLHLGAIQGIVDPAGASVWLDGSLTETASGWFSLPALPGVHSLQAQATGYAPFSTNLTVTPGNTSSITITLTLLPPPTGGGSNGLVGPFSATNVLWIGIAVLVVVGILAVAVWAGRRRRR